MVPENVLSYNSKGNILKYIKKICPYLIFFPLRSGIFSQFFLPLFFLTSLSELKEKKNKLMAFQNHKSSLIALHKHFLSNQTQWTPPNKRERPIKT